jgi:GDP-4-dehydro-6-deoxy-D-mannose reductase
MRRLLVLGASGFAGRHLAEHLSAQVSTDIVLVGTGRKFDLRDRHSLYSVVSESRPDWILHLAAQSSAAASIKDSISTYDVNTMGVARLVDVLRSTSFGGRLLFVSSSEVYGSVSPSRLPILEAETPRPRNPYAASKLAAEAICHEAFASGLDVVIVRPFNHIGPGQDRRFAVGSFAHDVASLMLGERPAVLEVGDLSIARDFTDVRDIVRGYLTLLRCAQSGQIYNLASGKATTLTELVQLLREVANVPFEIRVDKERLRTTETPVTIGDAGMAQALGWKPAISLQNTIRDMIQHLLNEKRNLQQHG